VDFSFVNEARRSAAEQEEGKRDITE